MRKGLITTRNLSVENYFKKNLGIELSATEPLPELVVSPGGSDVDPRYYDEDNRGQSRNTNPQRDYDELSLMFAAKFARIPIVGICRGHQLISVLYGLGLDQHLQTHKIGEKHQVFQTNGQLSSQLGDSEVNSTHHQGVPSAASDFFDHTLVSASGNVELIFDKNRSVFSTQFHPEYDVGDPRQKEVFHDYIKQLVG